jgi:uncharacterized Zn-finger protein
MFNKYTFIYIFAVITLCTVTGVVVAKMVDARDATHNQVVAVAEDLGCTFIEQSYYHPERFYIDCGDGNIQILTLGAK